MSRLKCEFVGIGVTRFQKNGVSDGELEFLSDIRSFLVTSLEKLEIVLSFDVIVTSFGVSEFLLTLRSFFQKFGLSC